jgi:hypothetical protein
MTSRIHCNAHDLCFYPLILGSSFQHCWRRLGPFLRFRTIYVARLHGDVGYQSNGQQDFFAGVLSRLASIAALA